MEWLVVDTVVCSSSGISFSILWCKIKLIIWYESDVFLPPGSSVSQTDSGIYIDGKFFPLTIYNVTPFNKTFWKIIECSNECPGRKSIKGAQCTSALHCRIAICPYGLIKQCVLISMLHSIITQKRNKMIIICKDQHNQPMTH